MKCQHENIVIDIKQVLYTTVDRYGMFEGDPDPISYTVVCNDCDLNTVYYKPPKWLLKRIDAIGNKQAY